MLYVNVTVFYVKIAYILQVKAVIDVRSAKFDRKG